LHRSGFEVVITEIEAPRALRRLVALAQAVYSGEVQIEDLLGRKVEDPQEARGALAQGAIPVLVDPELRWMRDLAPVALVDARMRKRPPEVGLEAAEIVVGLGPGFVAGVNCHAAIETNRGHHLGRVLWRGSPDPNTGVPGPVSGYDAHRVLRAPAEGHVDPKKALADKIEQGELIAEIGGEPLIAPFQGVLRGLVHPSVSVAAEEKVGDLDPRGDPAYCWEISDKSLAIGGGVLEALLSRKVVRRLLGG
jgi:xanthine dehydrogenase accessory factor